ncbi:MAG: hypothetical protein SGPRY_006229, partial [Prymnesium sp.]
GVDPAAQQRAILDTLKRLMTPVLPPFYRIFMGGVVPSRARGDPEWLENGAQSVVQVRVCVAPPEERARERGVEVELGVRSGEA